MYSFEITRVSILVGLASVALGGCLAEDSEEPAGSSDSALIEGCIDEDVDGAYVCTDGADPGAEPIDCDDSVARTAPGADELCNGIDDDCDGSVDEHITNCGDGAGIPADGDPEPPSDCVDADGDGAYVCETSEFGRPDCDDSVARTAPGADELCNGIDDDCDGSVDEHITNCGDGAGIPVDGDPEPPSDCVDGDGDGAYVCETSEFGRPDCDDVVARTRPGADEACNGVDDDCDGQIDENITNCNE